MIGFEKQKIEPPKVPTITLTDNLERINIKDICGDAETAIEKEEIPGFEVVDYDYNTKNFDNVTITIRRLSDGKYFKGNYTTWETSTSSEIWIQDPIFVEAIIKRKQIKVYPDKSLSPKDWLEAMIHWEDVTNVSELKMFSKDAKLGENNERFRNSIYFYVTYCNNENKMIRASAFEDYKNYNKKCDNISDMQINYPDTYTRILNMLEYANFHWQRATKPVQADMFNAFGWLND